MTTTVQLKRPHVVQREIIDDAARFNVVCCGRRFGKTLLGIDRLVTPETLAHPVGWFSPTYKMMLEVWRALTAVVQPITTRRNKSEYRVELATGGVIEFWSLDNADAARGRAYRRVVIDEAALVPNLLDAWQMVIRPTLTDYKGDAYFLSTPKGLNGFWKLYQLGQDDARPEWRAWQYPTTANPHIDPDEVAAMAETMPERTYSQEILAQFVDDGGGVFRRVMASATAVRQAEAVEGHQYAFGVDWGKQNDFTVITVIDLTERACVHMDRFNQIDYTTQIGRLGALYERFNPIVINAERNSMGEPVIEQLQRKGLPVRPFTTTNASKAQAIDALALAFERDDIRIINDPVLTAELMAYEATRLPSGMFRYSAPEGMHDDTVMSLAIGWQAAVVGGAELLF